MKKLPLLFKPLLFYIQKLIVTRSSQIVTCSPAQKEILEIRYPNHYFTVIEHGIDNFFYKR